MAVQAGHRAIVRVLITAFNQFDDSVAPSAVCLAPVGTCDEVEGCMVPVASGDERIESEQLLHGALVQRVCHINESVVGARTYLLNPVTVYVFDTTTRAMNIALHQLRALGFRKACTSSHDFRIGREALIVAQSIDTGLGLVFEQVLAIADCWHVQTIKRLARVELDTLLDQCHIRLAICSMALFRILSLLQLEVVDDGLQLVHDGLRGISTHFFSIFGDLVQILPNLFQCELLIIVGFRATSLLLLALHFLPLLCKIHKLGLLLDCFILFHLEVSTVDVQRDARTVCLFCRDGEMLLLKRHIHGVMLLLKWNDLSMIWLLLKVFTLLFSTAVLRELHPRLRR